MYKKVKIAIFASGTGSNAEAIIKHSKNSNFEVALIVTNNENAGVINFSEKYDIDALIIDRDTFYNDTVIVDFLEEKNIQINVLAGFLWLVPNYLIKAFKDKIINIHPSLLPKYGGKGMFGINVHKAVFENKEKESGITIHLINEEYDKGKILFQKTVKVFKVPTPELIAKKVLKLEHKFFSKVIEDFVENL